MIRARPRAAFTLAETLTALVILTLLAVASVPVWKDLRRGSAAGETSRQAAAILLGIPAQELMQAVPGRQELEHEGVTWELTIEDWPLVQTETRIPVATGEAELPTPPVRGLRLSLRRQAAGEVLARQIRILPGPPADGTGP
jgi:hypothetical protein